MLVKFRICLGTECKDPRHEKNSLEIFENLRTSFGVRKTDPVLKIYWNLEEALISLKAIFQIIYLLCLVCLRRNCQYQQLLQLFQHSILCNFCNVCNVYLLRNDN